MFSPPIDTRVPSQEHQASLSGGCSVNFSDREAAKALLQIAQAPQRASAGADPVPGRDAVPAAQTDAGPGGPGLRSEVGPQRASAGASPTVLWEDTKKRVDQIRKATPDKQKFLNHLQIDEPSLEAWYTAGSAYQRRQRNSKIRLYGQVQTQQRRQAAAAGTAVRKAFTHRMLVTRCQAATSA